MKTYWKRKKGCLNSDRQKNKQQLSTKMETTGNQYFTVKTQGIGNMPIKTPQYDHILQERMMSSTPHPQNKKLRTCNEN